MHYYICSSHIEIINVYILRKENGYVQAMYVNGYHEGTLSILIVQSYYHQGYHQTAG